jgi:hypothetical protein
MFRRLTLVLGVLVACGPDLPSVGVHEDAIVGGTAETDHTAVVAVLALAPSNYFLCSGTVVSPHVVLTAAHCVTGDDKPAGTSFYVYDGPVVPPISGTMPSGAGFHATQSVTWYPDYDAGTAEQVAANGSDALPVYDIGVVVTTDVLPAPPMVLRRTAFETSDVGKVFENVGYGRSDPSTSNSDGTRRHASATVTGLAPDMLELDGASNSICFADSGGPSTLTLDGRERVMGVHAWIKNGTTCTGTQFDTRVDTYVANFIDPQIDTADPGWRADAGETATPAMPKGGCSAVAGAPALLLALLLARRRRP